MTILIADIALASDQNKKIDNLITQKSEEQSDSELEVEKTDSTPINTETPQEKKSELVVSLTNCLIKLYL
jgi:hypothetical protein